MKKMFALIVCVAVCGAALFAQQLRVAVSPFDVRGGFTHDEAEVIYELFTTDLVSSGKVTVVDRNSFDKIMAEMKFQTTDWSDSDKAARLGRALNANSIIRGQLMKLGDHLVITVNILDINTALILSSSWTQFSEINDIFDRMTPLVNTVVEKLSFDIQNKILVKYKGPGGSVVIPAGVTVIGREAFLGCTGLTSVGIPNSVTLIEDSAFQDCTGLTSVSIPNSVTSIGWNAFSRCTGLTSVSIPNSVTSIGSAAFSGCTGLTSVSIPNSVTSIGNLAFYECSSLTSVSIPNSVTSIGSAAFSGCTGLTSVSIPNSVTSIGGSTFDGCRNLTRIELSRRTRIGARAFGNVPGRLWYRD